MNESSNYPGLDPTHAAIAAYLAGDLASVQAIFAPLADCLNAMLSDVECDDDTTLTGIVSR